MCFGGEGLTSAKSKEKKGFKLQIQTLIFKEFKICILLSKRSQRKEAREGCTDLQAQDLEPEEERLHN